MQNGADPKLNPKCMSFVNIYNPYTKKTHKALVSDTCKFCGKYDIAVSSGMFQEIVPGLVDPYVPKIDWGGPAVGG